MYAKFTANGLVKLDTLSDMTALDSMDWDIAFRRYVVRINSGFSGPSCEKVKCPCEADPKWNQTLAAPFIATNIYTPTFKMVSGPTDFGDFMISASIGASSGTCRAIDLNMPNAFSNTPQTPTTVVQGQACLDQITAFHDKLCPGGVCVFPNH